MNFLNLFASESLSGWQMVLQKGLPIMGVGMVGIFLVVGVIILSVWAMSVLTEEDSLLGKGIKAVFTKRK